MSGEVIYRPLIEDMTWSYSRIKCFQDCPYMFFLKYIYKSPSKPMFYSSYGSFIHKLLEQFYSGNITKEELPVKYMTGFQTEVVGDRPSAKIVTSYFHAGLDYFNNFNPFPLEQIAVEQEFKFKLGDNNLIGYVDYIGQKGNSLYIIDHKSRNLKPRSGRDKPTINDRTLDDMLKQLYLYALAVEQSYGKLPNKLCFNCFKNGQFIEEPFDIKTYFRVQAEFEDEIENIKNATDFPPNIDWFSCKYICDVSDDCCYCNGGDAY